MTTNYSDVDLSIFVKNHFLMIFLRHGQTLMLLITLLKYDLDSIMQFF